MTKKINCKWCGMGHVPRADGNHWIVKSIIPARIDIRECAYHKAGAVSPIAQSEPKMASPETERMLLDNIGGPGIPHC